jgi:hypothetical protein
MALASYANRRAALGWVWSAPLAPMLLVWLALFAAGSTPAHGAAPQAPQVRHAGAAPSSPGLPLRIVDEGSLPVAGYIDGALRCQLSAHQHCEIRITPGRHSIRLVRPTGNPYNGFLLVPDTASGGVFVTVTDRGQTIVVQTQRETND